MRASHVKILVQKCIEVRKPLLIFGEPGVGKSSVVGQANEEMEPERDLITFYPSAMEPIDNRGMPYTWTKNGKAYASFVPFGDWHRLLTTPKPTTCFIDDFGQGTDAVQKAFMPPLLEHCTVNGDRLPDWVTFVAATNERGQLAGVGGLLETVKSRMLTMVKLTVDKEAGLTDWLAWAEKNKLEFTLRMFLKFRPDLLLKFNPTRDMTNSPCPRTWAHLDTLIKMQLPQEMQLEAYGGAVGHEAATEYLAFDRLAHKTIPLDEIIAHPHKAALPDGRDLSVYYATMVGLAYVVNQATLPSVVIYLQRVDEAGKPEWAALCMKEAIRKKADLVKTRAYQTLVQSSFGQRLLGQ